MKVVFAIITILLLAFSVNATDIYINGVKVDRLDLSSGTVTPPPVNQCVYTYGDWTPSVCPASGLQTHVVTSALPAGCVGTPILSQSCTPAPVGEYGARVTAGIKLTMPHGGNWGYLSPNHGGTQYNGTQSGPFKLIPGKAQDFVVDPSLVGVTGAHLLNIFIMDFIQSAQHYLTFDVIKLNAGNNKIWSESVALEENQATFVDPTYQQGHKYLVVVGNIGMVESQFELVWSVQ